MHMDESLKLSTEVLHVYIAASPFHCLCGIHRYMYMYRYLHTNTTLTALMSPTHIYLLKPKTISQQAVSPVVHDTLGVIGCSLNVIPFVAPEEVLLYPVPVPVIRRAAHCTDHLREEEREEERVADLDTPTHCTCTCTSYMYNMYMFTCTCIQ